MGIEIRTNVPERKPAAPKSAREGSVMEAMEKGAFRPSKEKEAVDIQAEMRKAVESIILQKHQERLAYNAAYQRDLRTIKRLGLSVTVKQYRENLK